MGPLILFHICDIAESTVMKLSITLLAGAALGQDYYNYYSDESATRWDYGGGDDGKTLVASGNKYPDANGLFCWGCDAIAGPKTASDKHDSPYWICLFPADATALSSDASGGAARSGLGKRMGCKGQERVCMWEERREKNSDGVWVVASVCGGCKAPEACANQWNQNNRWTLGGGAVTEVPNECDDDSTTGVSTCRWCCKATAAAEGLECNRAAGSPVATACGGAVTAVDGSECDVAADGHTSAFADYTNAAMKAVMAAVLNNDGNLDTVPHPGHGRNNPEMAKVASTGSNGDALTIHNDAVSSEQLDEEDVRAA